EVVEQQIDDVHCEFSRINEFYTGKANQFVYASRFSEKDNAPRFDALVKFDRKNNTKEILEFDSGVFSGEFVFAAGKNSEAEDDGYLIGFVHDEGKQQSELHIIDTQHFCDGPIARIIMPVRVPYGFHAAWVAQ